MYGRGWRARSFDAGHRDDSGSPIDVEGWTNCLKNRLLRRVSRPEPSILTRYCSLSPTSTTTPDLSHLFGWGPRWFWTYTLAPITRGGRAREWAFRASEVRANRARIAFSFADQASRHIGRMDGFSNLVHLLTNENASLMGLPNITSAGDTLQSGSGVFLSCSMARNSPSLSSEPVGPMLSIRVRLAFLTATSARPLDCGKATEDMRW